MFFSSLFSAYKALQNQKKKTEEEKALAAQQARDNKNLSEACENLQKKSDKLQHDLHSKDDQILNLQGLLARSKQAQDGENGKVVLEWTQHMLLFFLPLLFNVIQWADVSFYSFLLLGIMIIFHF